MPTQAEIYEAGLDALLSAAAGMKGDDDGYLTDAELAALHRIADATEAEAKAVGDDGPEKHAEWSSTEHPRGKDGRFITGAQIAEAARDPAKAAALRRDTRPEDKGLLDEAVAHVKAGGTVREPGGKASPPPSAVKSDANESHWQQIKLDAEKHLREHPHRPQGKDLELAHANAQLERIAAVRRGENPPPVPNAGDRTPAESAAIRAAGQKARAGQNDPKHHPGHVLSIVKKFAGIGNIVPLTTVRRELASMMNITDRQQQDDAIMEARRQGLVSGVGSEGRHGLTAEHTAAQLKGPRDEHPIGYLSVKE